MRANIRITLCLASIAVAACGSDTKRTVYQLPVPSAQDAGSQSPPPLVADNAAHGTLVSKYLADGGDDWLTLIEADWELPAASEAHLCVRATVTRDAYLHEFAPEIPLGTHHTVLSVHETADMPDGVTSCGADVSGQNIYGSGVGTKNSVLPDGIAMHVKTGQQMLLNLHLFNADSKVLKGRSGVKVRTMAQADVKQEAEGVLAGPLSLTIPPGHVVQNGQCTFDHAATIFSVGPHMHRFGTHMKINAHRAAGDVLLFDGAYAFDSQQRYPTDFVQMQAGDVVQVECTYENASDQTVTWGQSSLDEMCFAGVTRFPAQAGSSYLCTD